jgi:endonuclease/exonuclease/phosphatase family metal-dependent hydrolase
MPTKFRVATFNCENLFSRAKIINLSSHDVAAGKLNLVDELNQLIHKPTNFTPTEKARIVELYGELKDYITIRENRPKKLFNRNKTKVMVASGKDWDGEIDFKRDHFSQLTRENTAKVIKSVKADVACLVEVEDRPTLAAFNSHMLASRKFKYSMVIDGNDRRGIDVGTWTNFPILSLHTHIFEGPANSRTFSRDCLRVEMELPNGESLHLLCNHFTSKSNGEAASDPRRRRQATRVAEILQEYDLKTEYVVVAGDLNDTPDEHSPLRPLLDVPNLFDVLELTFPDDPAARWTYHYQAFEQIDYLLVSKPLKEALVDCQVERRGIYKLHELTGGAESEFDTITHWTNAASDHGAIVAEFAV